MFPTILGLMSICVTWKLPRMIAAVRPLNLFSSKSLRSGHAPENRVNPSEHEQTNFTLDYNS